jgi:KDO2-lipid IV(A) lauroyltransferase
MVLVDFLCQQSINKYNIDDYFIFSNEAKKNLARSNGGCILSAHIGNWEMVLPAMGLNNIKMDTVIMRQKNKAANNFYIKLRAFKNINLIYKDGALKSLYKAIDEGRMVGLASDQNARRKGLKINFFGELSSFPKGAGKFYYKTKCSLFIVFCVLRSDLKYYVYTKEITVDPLNKTEDDIIEKIVSSYANELSIKIEQHPEQYFWFHKKWNKMIYK